MLASQPYPSCIMHANALQYTRRAFSSFFLHRLKGLRHWFSNAIRFDSIQFARKMEFHFVNGKNQQWNSTPRSWNIDAEKKKNLRRKRGWTATDKCIDRTTSIIIVKAKKLCFTGVKHSFPLKPCNLYRAHHTTVSAGCCWLESAYKCICLNCSEYVFKRRHSILLWEPIWTSNARTRTHQHTSRVPACIFHATVSTTYLDTIYLKMVKW